MTQEESRIQTMRKIRLSKNGKEVSQAIIEHFKSFKPIRKLDELAEMVNSPIEIPRQPFFS